MSKIVFGKLLFLIKFIVSFSLIIKETTLIGENMKM